MDQRTICLGTCILTPDVACPIYYYEMVTWLTTSSGRYLPISWIRDSDKITEYILSATAISIRSSSCQRSLMVSHGDKFVFCVPDGFRCGIWLLRQSRRDRWVSVAQRMAEYCVILNPEGRRLWPGLRAEPLRICAAGCQPKR